jgi:hypothetical protein
MTHLFRRKRRGESDAPSTALRAVPLPRYPPPRSALRRTQTRRSSPSERRRVAGAEEIDSRSRDAFFVRTRVLPSPTARKAPTKHDPEKCSRFSDQIMLPKKGAERRKAQGRFRGPADKRCRLPCDRRGARPFGRRARLPALYRGSCQRLSALAQSGPALHGSGQPIRSPGSQLLADRRRGRPGEFPNRPRTRLRTPSRAPLPLASIGRHRLTSLGRARWAFLVRRAVRIQEIPLRRAIPLI